MSGIRGKISNPPSVKTEIIEKISGEIVIHTPTMGYQSRTDSPFLSTSNAWFFPLDLSKVDNIFVYQNPILNGQSIFRSRQTEQKIPLFFNGNVTLVVTVKLFSLMKMNMVQLLVMR
jgi:hypothetical protein